MSKQTTKQNKVAEPAVYYTTVNLATNKSNSLKTVVPFELIGKLKIKNGDNLFWQQTSDGKMLVWRRKKNEKISDNVKESGTIRRKTKSPPRVKKAPDVIGSNTGTTEGTQPQISSTTTV